MVRHEIEEPGPLDNPFQARHFDQPDAAVPHGTMESLQEIARIGDMLEDVKGDERVVRRSTDRLVACDHPIENPQTRVGHYP